MIRGRDLSGGVSVRRLVIVGLLAGVVFSLCGGGVGGGGSGVASAAVAPGGRESTFQDDNLLVYNTPIGVARTLNTLVALGVDRIRVSVFWRVVAPDPKSTVRPANFNAADPNSYPGGSWARYDTIVAFAKARGIAVNFNVTDPAPLWATGRPPRSDIQATYNPSASEFGQFVTAVATRYTGGFAAPIPIEDTGAPGPVGILPRVSYWSIWNEPNQAGWLTPQLVPGSGGQLIERSPTLYRQLFNAAYAALTATGHAADTILVGETAPEGLTARGLPKCSAKRGPSVCTGSIKPLHFARQLYCLDDGYHPLTGAAAAARGCPTTAAGRASFATDNPGLFQATGWAHHPYSLIFPPSHKPTDRDNVSIANLPILTGDLRRIFAVYGAEKNGLPLYLTEFGFQSDPPSILGVTVRQQAAYLDESEFIAYTDPGVRTLGQFLLKDDNTSASSAAQINSTFQTGLEFSNGRHKPAYDAYRFPVYLPVPRIARGHRLRVWGFVRVAPYGTNQTVEIQYQARGGSAFRTISNVATDGRRGYLDVRIAVPRSGALRLLWTDPKTKAVVVSRTVGFKVS
ncbi:MAG: hypothetical protein QOH12_1537 [Solirubrobacteraceae bacterium]|jgi:hypothetical protein|nr:hypothetical protein [Solirubrobacteraceae bacterium]